MDKAFFGIVRRFGLVIAFLALTATVGALVWGIMLYRTPVHSEIAKPRLDYQKFKDSLAPSNQENATANSEQSPTTLANVSKTPFDIQFEKYVRQITANINRYLISNATVPEEPVGKICKNMTDRFPADQHDLLALSFMDQLAKTTATFVDDSSNKLNTVDASTDRGKRLETFISWASAELQTQIEAENARVRTEEAKAVADKAQAIQLVGAAGTAFVVFIFFTLMLVLIAIERNTRPINVSRPPEASTAAPA